MEDTTEEAFGLLSQWFYTQKLEGEFGGREKAVPTLCRLWILAEKLLIPRLQNLVIDLIETERVKYNVVWTLVFHHVWDNTAANSPLRRLFISQAAWYMNEIGFRTHVPDFPKEMLAEICFLLSQDLRTKANTPRDMAEFHVKEDEQG